VQKMLGKYENIDRRLKEPDLESIDAIMLTLDAEYLKRTLNTIYRKLSFRRYLTVRRIGRIYKKCFRIVNVWGLL